jgi:ATP-dependent protease HslVU (ClpYQ) peptidase subunit
MSLPIIKVANTEISVTAANTVYGSQLVRLCNITAGNILITVAGSEAGTFTVRANTEVYVKKAPTDTIAANAAISAAPVGFF